MSDDSDSLNEDLLRGLLDREAIRDLARYYAHYVWERDIHGIANLFAEDGEMDTPDLPIISGRQAIIDEYQKLLGEDEFHPFVHNHVIDLDADTATGTCYLDLRATVAGNDLFSSGWYNDRYVRVDGEWKFQYRKVTMCAFVPVHRARSEKPK